MKSKTFIFMLPFLIISVFCWLKIKSNSTYLTLIQEDHLIEYSQSFFYFLAAWVAAILTRVFYKNNQILYTAAYFLASLSLLFVCLEEINWGQRIFNLVSPEFFRVNNAKSEISVHSLMLFAPYHRELYVFAGLAGGLLWLLAPRISEPEYLPVLPFFTPPWYLSFYFLPVFLINFYFDFLSYIPVTLLKMDNFRIGYFIIWQDQEPGQFLMSLGLLLFMVINLINKKDTVSLKCPAMTKENTANIVSVVLVLITLHILYILMKPALTAEYGSNLLNQGQYKAAIKHYAELLPKTPPDNRKYLHSNYGAALLGDDRLEAAIDSFEQVLVDNPRDVYAHNNLGMAKIRQGRIGEAVKHFKKALELLPGYQDAVHNLQTVTKALDQIETRIATIKTNLDKNLDIKPNKKLQLWFTLGELYRAADQPAQAIAPYSHALEISIKHLPAKVAEIAYRLLVLYAKQKQDDQALTYLKIAVKHGFNNWEMLKADRNLQSIRQKPYAKQFLTKLPLPFKIDFFQGNYNLPPKSR